MPASRQHPLEARAGDHEHDFTRPREDWDATVFDRAAYFSVVELRTERSAVGKWWAKKDTYFVILPWAIRFARNRADACLYAVTSSGRFALLDRDKWFEWEMRWRRNRNLPERVAVANAKPHRGTITEWELVQDAPHGLGFRVEGRMGGRRVTTTSVLSREGVEVETLSWRYTLG